MSAGTAARTARPPQVAPPAPTWPVTLTVTRQVRRGTLVVSAIAGGMTAFVAAQYQDTFSGAVSASSLEALAQNPAVRTLFGPPVALDDPGGFTVWRLGTVLAVLVGIWAALTATRVTRGEEEAGRWDLLLAGRLRLAALIRVHLARAARCDGVARTGRDAGPAALRRATRRVRCCSGP